MESQPQNPEFRNNPENFQPFISLNNYPVATCKFAVNVMFIVM